MIQPLYLLKQFKPLSWSSGKERKRPLWLTVDEDQQRVRLSYVEEPKGGGWGGLPLWVHGPGRGRNSWQVEGRGSWRVSGSLVDVAARYD